MFKVKILVRDTTVQSSRFYERLVADYADVRPTIFQLLQESNPYAYATVLSCHEVSA